MAKDRKTEYNVRITDNDNGTYSIVRVSRLKTTDQPTWVEDSENKIIRLLTNGAIAPRQ